MNGLRQASALFLLAASLASAAPDGGSQRDGIVLFSDGQKIEGKVSLTSGKDLLVRVSGRAQPLSFALSELSRIETTVLAEGLEKVWRFKEEGNPEKVFTGETYPHRDFGVRLTLTDGRLIEGTLAKGTPIYVRLADGRRRVLFLPKEVKGEAGQTLKDLTHVKEISFVAPRAESGGAKEAPPSPAQPAPAD